MAGPISRRIWAAVKLVLDLCSSITSSRIALKTVLQWMSLHYSSKFISKLFSWSCSSWSFPFLLGCWFIAKWQSTNCWKESREREREKTQLPSQVHGCYSFAVLFDSWAQNIFLLNLGERSKTAERLTRNKNTHRHTLSTSMRKEILMSTNGSAVS